MADSEHPPETVAHLTEEILELSEEQGRALEDATFVPMSEIQEKEYSNRRTRLLNIIREFTKRLRPAG